MPDRPRNIQEGWSKASIDAVPVAISDWLRDFDKCLNYCETTQDISKKIDELLLFQKQYQHILGVPGRPHAEQSENVLKNVAYWDFSNRLQLFEMRKEILEKSFDRYTSFSVGGSIWAGYLGYLHGMQESGKLPQVIFGASAWSLFPAIYLLWQQALKTNPEETKPEFTGLLSYLPKWMEEKTMWSNGEELISAFQGSCQTLIDLINKKRPEDQKLPSADKLKISDVSKTFGIIASRKNEGNGKFQEVIFSGDDPLVQSVIASSNPEISILGMKFSVITDKKNKFLGNTWHDGDHTNYNPIEYGDILGVSERIQVTPFNLLQKKDIEIISYDKEVNLNLNPFGTSFRLPKIASKLQLQVWHLDPDFGYTDPTLAPDRHVTEVVNAQPTDPSSQYAVTEQNDGWGFSTMEHRAKLTYIQSLIYAIDGTGNYHTGILKTLTALKNISLTPTDKSAIVDQLIQLISRFPLQGVLQDTQWYLRDRIFVGYDLATKINESTIISAKQKKDLILSVFYSEGTLIEPRLSSALLPLDIPTSNPDKKTTNPSIYLKTIGINWTSDGDTASLLKKYDPKNMDSIRRTWKLPASYIAKSLSDISQHGTKHFLQSYDEIIQYADEDFFRLNIRSHLGSFKLCLRVIFHDPRYASQFIEIAEWIHPLDMYYIMADSKDVELFFKFIDKVPNTALQANLRTIYTKHRSERIQELKESLNFLTSLPEAKGSNK